MDQPEGIQRLRGHCEVSGCVLQHYKLVYFTLLTITDMIHVYTYMHRNCIIVCVGVAD